MEKILYISTHRKYSEQGRKHGRTVLDNCAGTEMQKPLEIQKCYGWKDSRTDGLTDTARCRVACPRLKTVD